MIIRFPNAEWQPTALCDHPVQRGFILRQRERERRSQSAHPFDRPPISQGVVGALVTAQDFVSVIRVLFKRNLRYLDGSLWVVSAHPLGYRPQWQRSLNESALANFRLERFA